MRIKLIANPISGGDSSQQINVAMDVLSDLGAKVELFLTSARGDARAEAENTCPDNFDRIVAAGGDGTLNEVVNGVTSSKLPIAFLPLGTVNVFALEAGIPFDIKEACKVAVYGELQKVTLGRVNEELFLLMTSAGWDAEAVAGVRPIIKRIAGRMAYALSAVEEFLRKPPALLSIQLPDGRQMEGYGVVISNCRYYGGRYVVTPGASMLKRSLDVCLLRQGGRLALLKFAMLLAFKQPLKKPLVEFLDLDELEVSGEGVSVQVDGDNWGRLPIAVAAVPEAVTMVLPLEKDY